MPSTSPDPAPTPAHRERRQGMSENERAAVDRLRRTRAAGYNDIGGAAIDYFIAIIDRLDALLAIPERADPGRLSEEERELVELCRERSTPAHDRTPTERVRGLLAIIDRLSAPVDRYRDALGEIKAGLYAAGDPDCGGSLTNVERMVLNIVLAALDPPAPELEERP